MKDIGLKLKEARESIGVSVEEVAEDLKVRASQIENIEAGNSDAFKDIFNLKYLIRDYSKYLGLNKEDLVDEFNEYLFDVTSRISLDDIKKAKKERNDAKRIKSPYTIDKKSIPVYKIILICFILVLLAIIFLIISDLNKTDEEDFIEGSVVSERR